jgi:hypothetical protein
MTDRGQRRWPSLPLYLVTALSTMSHGSTELVYPLNLDRLGHPLPMIGTTVALMGLGSLASRIPGGAWYRHSRARLLSVVSLTLMGLSTLGLGVGEAWGVQASLGVVHGFSFGLATTFLLALLIAP